MKMLVTIARYSLPYEAQLAKANLEAAGIPVVLANEHTISAQWLYSDALGGVGVQVSPENEQQARLILATDFSEEFDGDNDTQTRACAACGSQRLESFTKGKRPAFVVFLLLGFPLFFYKHGLRCRDCGAFNEI